MIVTEDVPEALVDQRLDRVVTIIAGCSRADAARWVADGRVTVDGHAAHSRAMRLRVGMRLSIDVPDSVEDSPQADASIPFAVIDADESVVVVDKPAGLVVHPAPGHPDGTLVNGLLARFPDIADIGEPGRPGIVHRLDRGTSGLLVVARNESAHESLVAALAAHEVHREYAALVLGHPAEDRGMVDAPIGRSTRDAIRMTVTSAGKPARTRYEVVERYRTPVPTTQLTCELETGRTHQIRVHLSAIDTPIVGDEAYGGRCADLPLGRPFLHARALSFTHPGTGREVRYTTPLPSELSNLLEMLGR